MGSYLVSFFNIPYITITFMCGIQYFEDIFCFCSSFKQENLNLLESRKIYKYWDKNGIHHSLRFW